MQHVDPLASFHVKDLPPIPTPITHSKPKNVVQPSILEDPACAVVVDIRPAYVWVIQSVFLARQELPGDTDEEDGQVEEDGI